MVRHIFIATIKEGVSDEIVNQKMEEMRAMKESVSEIESIMVGRSLGWVGAAVCFTGWNLYTDTAGNRGTRLAFWISKRTAGS